MKKLFKNETDENLYIADCQNKLLLIRVEVKDDFEIVSFIMDEVFDTMNDYKEYRVAFVDKEELDLIMETVLMVGRFDWELIRKREEALLCGVK